MKDKTILEMYLEDMKNIKPLDEAKKDDLLKALCTGDNNAKNRLIEAHMMYVTELVQPFMGLISESHLALTVAVTEYKSGDLKAQIRQAVEKRLNEIIDEQNRAKHDSNELTNRLNELMEISSALANEYGREATAKELSDRLLIPQDEVEELLKISLNAINLDKNI